MEGCYHAMEGCYHASIASVRDSDVLNVRFVPLCGLKSAEVREVPIGDIVSARPSGYYGAAAVGPFFDKQGQAS